MFIYLIKKIILIKDLKIVKNIDKKVKHYIIFYNIIIKFKNCNISNIF